MVVPGLMHAHGNKLATAGTDSTISEVQKGSTNESESKRSMRKMKQKAATMQICEAKKETEAECKGK